MSFNFHLCTANVAGAQRNLHYPNHVKIEGADGLKRAARMDHVAAVFEKAILSFHLFL